MWWWWYASNWVKCISSLVLNEKDTLPTASLWQKASAKQCRELWDHRSSRLTRSTFSWDNPSKEKLLCFPRLIITSVRVGAEWISPLQHNEYRLCYFKMKLTNNWQRMRNSSVIFNSSDGRKQQLSVDWYNPWETRQSGKQQNDSAEPE